MQQHFEDLLGNPPSISNEEITPIVTEELDIKKGLFSLGELKKAVSSIQYRKACGLDEIPAEIWKLHGFHQILPDMCNSVYTQPRPHIYCIAKNYRGITLRAIAAISKEKSKWVQNK